jgi:hypothetical protein
MAIGKEIEISISPDGSLKIEQISGYEGKECVGGVDDLINSLGKDKVVKNTKEWYKQQKVHINQRNS